MDSWDNSKKTRERIVNKNAQSSFMFPKIVQPILTAQEKIGEEGDKKKNQLKNPQSLDFS